jgi:hypothetical protein
MNKKTVFSILGIIIVVILVIVCSVTLKNQYKSPINNYFKGIQKADINAYAKAFPDFMKVDKTISKDSLKQDLDDLKVEYGDKIKIKYEVISKEKIDQGSLGLIEGYVEKRYNKKVNISDGYILNLKVTLKGSKDSNTDTPKMYVYKIDGKWKYMPFSPESVKTYVTDN